jgi:hypothetical protein
MGWQYPPPYGAPTSVGPVKQRPRAAWFVVGLTLLVLGAAAFVAGLVWVLLPLT